MTSVGQITGQIASTKSFGELTTTTRTSSNNRGSRAGAAVYASVPDKYFTMLPQQTDGQRDLTAAWLGD